MTLEFQIYDWSEDHENENDDDDSDENPELVYIIHTFGRTAEGKSVYMKITDYHPSFYIKLPEKWELSEAKNNVKKMKVWLKSKKNVRVWERYRSSLLKMLVGERKSAEGFTNNKIFLFAKLIFDNSRAMKGFKKLFELNKVCQFLILFSFVMVNNRVC